MTKPITLHLTTHQVECILTAVRLKRRTLARSMNQAARTGKPTYLIDTLQKAIVSYAEIESFIARRAGVNEQAEAPTESS